MKQRYWLHALLFVITFISCMIAGTQWANVDPSEITHWSAGLMYAVLIMTFLTSHEFGHYIAARIHKVEATLPFYIPMPFVLFGTMGAVIKTRSQIPSRKQLFDIGVAGPIAGFVVCIIILIIGFATLPPYEHIYTIHPEYRVMDGIPQSGMYFGDSILFSTLRSAFSVQFMPPMNEIYHYPFLCVGWFGLFVTALNMAPFGNLDGGHVLYALVGGKTQRMVARTLWWLLFAFGAISVIAMIGDFLRDPSPNAFLNWLSINVAAHINELATLYPTLFTLGEGWLLWALLVRFFIRVDHPEIDDPEALSPGRQLIGWLSIAILIVCLPVKIIYFVQ